MPAEPRPITRAPEPHQPEHPVTESDVQDHEHEHEHEAGHGDPHTAGGNQGGVIEQPAAEPKAPDAGDTTHTSHENEDWIHDMNEKNFTHNQGEADHPVTQEPGVKVPLDKTTVTAHHNPAGIDGFNRFVLMSSIGPDGPVLGIEPKDLTTFMEADPNRTDYMIIDLRTEKDFTNSENKFQIEGAKHLPILEDPVPGSVSYKGLLAAQPAVPTAISIAGEAKTRKTWESLLNDKRLPIADSLNKKYVFFHCAQSTNRTPFVASGYARYLAKPDQHVIIIEGGWNAYKATPTKRVTPYNGEPGLHLSNSGPKVGHVQIDQQ